MYPTWVYDILLYGGALLIILSIIFMASLLYLFYKRQKLLTTGARTIEYVGQSLLVPVVSLFSLFGQTKKKTSTGKTTQ